MLTEEQIIALADEAYDKWNSEADRYNQWDSLGQDEIFVLVARAIESAVRAEYADVPPEKFKRLYKFCRSAKRRTIPQTYALNAIDNGTYNKKIGGEE